MQSTLSGMFKDTKYTDITLYLGTYIHAHRCVLALSDSKFILKFLKNETIYFYSHPADVVYHCIGWFYGIDIPKLKWKTWCECMRLARYLQSPSLIARLTDMKVLTPAEEIIDAVGRGSSIDMTDLAADISERGFKVAVHPFIDISSDAMGIDTYNDILFAMIASGSHYIISIAILCARTHTFGSMSFFKDRFRKFADLTLPLETLKVVCQLPHARNMAGMKLIANALAHVSNPHDAVSVTILDYAESV